MACIAGQVTGPPKGGVIDGITVSLSGVGTTVTQGGGWAVFCGTCADGSACNTEPSLPFCEGDGSRCSGIQVGTTHTFTYKCPVNGNWYSTWPTGAKTVTQACYWYDGYNCNCGTFGCGSLIIKSTNCRIR
ncbi:MAG: hypothetical protein PHF51_04995 [Candidatus ainarchaeum sp.]|nr:hypothetical protein [Candidatus ainarchaeum sp.]